MAFAAWRLLLAAMIPPLTVIAATGLVTAALLGSLIWLHQSDARTAGHAYVPAQIENGRIIPGHAAP